MTTSMAIERAAGGLVVRQGARGREVLMIDDAYGHISFPKGHVEPGETWEEAAVREIFEETGIKARILAPLGRVEYRISRDGRPVRKQVRLFLLQPDDTSQHPRPQEEEVRGARYVAWEAAAREHAERGYANWNWVLDKAAVIWAWLTEGHEQTWRELSATVDEQQLTHLWTKVRDWVDQLLAVSRRELEATVEWAGELPAPVSLQLPLPGLGAEAGERVRAALEHTLLRPEAGVLDIERVVDEARRMACRAVCIHPQHVALAAERLAGTGTKVCTVVGFPLGAEDAGALADEARRVAAAGAGEIDMVIPIGSMCEDDVWTVYEHVRAVVEAAREHAGVRVKTILETHYLTIDQMVKAGYAALAAGSDFLKTSTGFAPQGAQLADVALLARMTGLEAAGGRGVKAAGGIRTPQQARAFLRMGASRLGASSGLALLGE
ncbi:deoxyribose-phosphate aldolase [Alicyclobacillus kakegawensis]|uniref:deoxyribose-phosphate aldolase n=1 Tax=Alicyclobacillus kakegawensis TaxID=392012 RepID=UPI000AD99127|nr:deoxyribose-phosphate aldolase [Alicyclobacillus kakegawensis]